MHSPALLIAAFAAAGLFVATGVVAQETYCPPAFKDPAPTGTNCNAKRQVVDGPRANRARIETKTVPDFETCAFECLVSTGQNCKTLQYDASTKNCTTFSKSGKRIGLTPVPSGSSITFSNVDCFFAPTLGPNFFLQAAVDGSSGNIPVTSGTGTATLNSTAPFVESIHRLGCGQVLRSESQGYAESAPGGPIHYIGTSSSTGAYEDYIGNVKCGITEQFALNCTSPTGNTFYVCDNKLWIANALPKPSCREADVTALFGA